MEDRWCNACGVKFTPRAQSPGQTYCALPQCQRARKQVWQQAKRRSDPDYSANQAKAQSDWVKRNPDYWRSYRQANPDYALRNRSSQNLRNTARRIAKSDASIEGITLKDGLYRLQLMEPSTESEKVVLVRLTVLGTLKR